MNNEQKEHSLPSASLEQNGMLAADTVTRISNVALRDFYNLHRLISRIDDNYRNDKDNPMMADKHTQMIEKAKSICQKWINSKPPRCW